MISPQLISTVRLWRRTALRFLDDPNNGLEKLKRFTDDVSYFQGFGMPFAEEFILVESVIKDTDSLDIEYGSPEWNQLTTLCKSVEDFKRIAPSLLRKSEKLLRDFSQEVRANKTECYEIYMFISDVYKKVRGVYVDMH